jgi:uncharacterized protein
MTLGKSPFPGQLHPWLLSSSMNPRLTRLPANNPLAALAVLFFLACNGCEMTSPKSDFGYRKPNAPELVPGPIAGTLTKGGEPQPHLSPTKRTYVLVQVDGGGIEGITPALVLADIEDKIYARQHKRLRDIVSVFSGTSTGAILVGLLDAGIPADTIAQYYETTGVDLFNGKGRNPALIAPVLMPIFNRKAFQESVYATLRSRNIPEKITLGDLYNGPLLLIAAYDLCSERTLWMRTRDPGDQPLEDDEQIHNGRMQLVDAISASAFSAAYYFGKLPAPDVVWDQWQSDGTTQQVRGAVFNDGGQGTENNTLGQTALQAILRDWGNQVSNDDQVVILSFGCGNYFGTRTYDQASMLSNGGQLLAFLSNQARAESTILQWRAVSFISAHNPNIKVFRFDYIPSPGSSAFSAAKWKDYAAAATAPPDPAQKDPGGLIYRPDYVRLVDDLCNVKNFASVKPAPAPANRAVVKQKSKLRGF